jgi:general nucleoside transport system ATP-binding protein
MTAAAAASPAPELCLDHLVKDFGAVRALADASLTLRPGTVHALLGENGAGKTTLMRIAYGLLQPTAGRVLISGRAALFRSPADAIRAGIGMVHQHFTNVPAMSVAENVALGDHGLYAPRAAIERVRRLSERTQLVVDPEARVEWLSVAAQQKLEILKALAREARILILDEPTAVLAPAEASELLGWLRRFVKDGASVILITHKLEEALAVADETTVLRYGRTVSTASASTTSANELASAMLGMAPPQERLRPNTAPGEVALRVVGLRIDDARAPGIVDATFEVRKNEILGVAALENSGHELLLRAIAGRVEPTSGFIQRLGGTALVPEDRQRDALISSFSLAENVALRGASRRRGHMRWSRLRERAKRLIGDYDIRASSVDALAAELSGGNQQKLVLARELSDEPSIIVAENPTRGLDFRATGAVHDRLRDAAAGGAAVVIHSSDLDEVLSLATRLIAVHKGRVRAVPNDREAVGRAMLGLS